MVYDLTGPMRRLSLDGVLRRVNGSNTPMVLFPSMFAPLRDILCYSVNGWSSANYQHTWVGSSPASAAEPDFARLLEELQNDGYRIRVVSRRTQAHRDEHTLQGAAWSRNIRREGELLSSR
jgi:hypothetical protein